MNGGVVYTETRSVGVLYLALRTDPEGDSCFSIYQISWIKIKKDLFANKRRHLEFVYVSADCVSVIIFYDFVANSERSLFFYRPLNTNKPNFVSFLVFLGAAALFSAKISSFETVAKREAILNPVPKQSVSKDIPNFGSQSERAKIAIH